MKKFIKSILFLCAISSLAYAEEAAPDVTSGTTMSAEEQKEAMDILDRMREKIEKEEAEKAKLIAEAKPKTEAEKLELTRKKALNKLDFYERVVRSVAREENEVSDYYGVMGEEKQRSTVYLGTAEAAAEQQVEQNAAPAEIQPETPEEAAK